MSSPSNEDIERRFLEAFMLADDVDGWFDIFQCRLLFQTAVGILSDGPSQPGIVEVGSYLGRSTIILASAIKWLAPQLKVTAIDPHLGEVTSPGTGATTENEPTYTRFLDNLARAEMREYVEVFRSRSVETPWEAPIHLLLIDGLHDYGNVSADFIHFEPHIARGGVVAFDDYCDVFPGVTQLVQELRSTGRYVFCGATNDLVLVRRIQ